jgi:hypothetical protein
MLNCDWIGGVIMQWHQNTSPETKWTREIEKQSVEAAKRNLNENIDGRN